MSNHTVGQLAQESVLAPRLSNNGGILFGTTKTVTLPSCHEIIFCLICIGFMREIKENRRPTAVERMHWVKIPTSPGRLKGWRCGHRA